MNNVITDDAKISLIDIIMRNVPFEKGTYSITPDSDTIKVFEKYGINPNRIQINNDIKFEKVCEKENISIFNMYHNITLFRTGTIEKVNINISISCDVESSEYSER